MEESIFQLEHARIAFIQTTDMENNIKWMNNEHLVISSSVLYSSGVSDKLSSKM